LPRLAATRRALVVGFALAATGCVVTVYQPMSGLHRPAVVDPRLPNLEDVRLTVRCVPGGLLNAQEAGALCQKVGLLFENQGATVTTVAGDRSAGDTGTDAGGDDADGPPPTDLTLELRAREVHRANNPLGWALCIGSFTVIPAVTESTFAQDVAIRDASGFLLVSDTLEGRLVTRFGFGAWLGNELLDLTVRDDREDLTNGAAGRDLSADLYRQLSQLVFNAKMQWQVLQQVPGGPR
jgi:hypothetical protein